MAELARKFPVDLTHLFAGAFGAALVGRLTENLGLFGFAAAAPIIVIVYFTYRTYLTNVEASAAQAEQAKLHVRN